MKSTFNISLVLVLTLSVAALLWPAAGLQAQAQSGCKPLQAIVQASLPTSTPMALTDTWGGPIYGMLGGEPLVGAISGNDGAEEFKQHIGTGKDGLYTVCVGYPSCTDSFTYEVPHSVFPIPPGKIGFAYYIGNTAKIIGGTGIFKYASGNLNVSGPAVAWPLTEAPYIFGRWNPEISGKICGIQ